MKIFIPLDDVIDPFILSIRSRLVRALIKQFLWWWIVLVPPYSVLQSIKLSIHSKTDEAHIERSDASQVLLQKSVWIFFHNTYKSVALCFVVGWLQLIWFCCTLDIMYFLNYYCFEFDFKFFSFYRLTITYEDLR